MNGLQYLMGAAYKTQCEFASMTGFEEYLAPYFADTPFQHQQVSARVLEVIRELEEQAPSDGQFHEKALKLAVARDLRRLADVIASNKMHDPVISLESCRERYETIMRGVGLSFPRPKLFIVDTFPSPYNEMDWTATSPDPADQESYGIEPGNYFKKKHLVPYRSDLLLAHEILHFVIGQVDARWLGRGLEEGLAVVFGELYVGAQVFGADMAYLYALYQWFDVKSGQLNTLYAEYARMAALIYQLYGLKGTIALIQGGRQQIKKAEQSCLDGNFELGLPRGDWDSSYSLLVERVALSTVKNLHVSPGAALVARYVEQGRTVTEIADRAGLSEEQVSTALEELQLKVFLVVTDGGRVDYSDINLVSKSRSLRYDV